MNSYDTLTGLYDKTGFFQKVQEVLRENKKEKYQIIVINVKNFKVINDLFGMQAGDRLLIKIAGELKENTLPGGICSRLEADTFGIFTPVQRGKQMIDFLSATKFYIDESSSCQMHVNMGVYEIEDTTVPVPIMCDRANMALRTIKENRMEKIAYYNESMRERVLKEQVLTAEIQRAMENRELKLYLQGLYNSKGKLLGAEALVRWEHPARGVLAAGHFIDILENNGMIVQLDQYMWRCACEQLRKWKQEGKNNLFVSVNISVKDFAVIDVCDVLVNLITEYDIEPEKLRLEITETALMHDVEKNLEVIDQLRLNGFVVEIDDFGSGYSSLNMLKDINADVVKLDMRFLQKSKNEDRSKTILRMIVALIKELNMQIIVEGVETQEQLEFLKELECDVFQGYYFMRPVSVEIFEKEISKEINK